MPALRTRSLQPGQKIRVLVVDDSVVIRRLVCHALEEDPAIEVVGVAANGAIALNRIPQTNPDVITLDIEMPEVDGLDMLRRLRRENREIRVVMFSTMTERGATATLEALALGADDYVTKASNAGSLDVSLANLRQQLIPKIRQFFRLAPSRESPPSTAPPAVLSPPALSAGVRRTPWRAQAVAIGVSTGGPAALTAIMPHFPAGFRVPIFIVQHMPTLFTRLLAERLDTLTPLAVREAVAGEKPEPGASLHCARRLPHESRWPPQRRHHCVGPGAGAEFLPPRRGRSLCFPGGDVWRRGDRDGIDGHGPGRPSRRPEAQSARRPHSGAGRSFERGLGDARRRGERRRGRRSAPAG